MEQLEIGEEIMGHLLSMRKLHHNSLCWLYLLCIIHFFSYKVIWSVALRLAFANLRNLTFSLELEYKQQHYISCHTGREEYGVIRKVIRKFLLIDL